MKEFKIVVDIKAPASQVFAVLRDVERWPEWTPTVTSIQRAENGPLAVGSSAWIKQPKLRDAVWRVTELEDGKRFAWVTRSPGVQVKGDHVVESAGTGSKVTLSIQVWGLFAPLVAGLYRGLFEQYLATEANGLRRRCEAEAPEAA
jgi:uncharacterized membrane protein